MNEIKPMMADLSGLDVIDTDLDCCEVFDADVEDCLCECYGWEFDDDGLET